MKGNGNFTQDNKIEKRKWKEMIGNERKLMEMKGNERKWKEMKEMKRNEKKWKEIKGNSWNEKKLKEMKGNERLGGWKEGWEAGEAGVFFADVPYKMQHFDIQKS